MATWRVCDVWSIYGDLIGDMKYGYGGSLVLLQIYGNGGDSQLYEFFGEHDDLLWRVKSTINNLNVCPTMEILDHMRSSAIEVISQLTWMKCRPCVGS